ncbi:hypothetical protein [Burkholderia ubonensis]|uniref:hypothetical protein n=1 Tax=Burkholderia ubonensis TaxID=101571 RepID=UPI00075DB73F|nr:hypothetical protein [Burkholderia ubonensis]KVP28927.1 hypothetical protein WJ87_27005 [Burkholderia ubonensis]
MNQHHLVVRTRADRRAIPVGIKEAISPVFPVKLSHLQEACAAARGFQSDAAMVAAMNAGATFSAEDFSYLAFVDRLAALSSDPVMAEAAALALEGVTLAIDIARYSTARQRHDLYADWAYGVQAQLMGLPPEAISRTSMFDVPDNFGATSNGPAIRLASAHQFKVDGDFAVTRRREGRELLTTRLIDGRWEGGMYVDLPDTADDTRAIGSVKAALARAIVPIATSWTRCWIYRPDGYDEGAWRVQLSLGHAARAAAGNSNVVFDIPQHPQRLVHVDAGYLYDLNPDKRVFKGKVVDGTWSADVYSNGVSETANAVPIGALRAMLMRNVNVALGRK